VNENLLLHTFMSECNASIIGLDYTTMICHVCTLIMHADDALKEINCALLLRVATRRMAKSVTKDSKSIQTLQII
jgi:hypothetical protein